MLPRGQRRRNPMRPAWVQGVSWHIGIAERTYTAGHKTEKNTYVLRVFDCLLCLPTEDRARLRSASARISPRCFQTPPKHPFPSLPFRFAETCITQGGNKNRTLKHRCMISNMCLVCDDILSTHCAHMKVSQRADCFISCSTTTMYFVFLSS